MNTGLQPLLELSADIPQYLVEFYTLLDAGGSVTKLCRFNNFVPDESGGLQFWRCRMVPWPPKPDLGYTQISSHNLQLAIYQ